MPQANQLKSLLERAKNVCTNKHNQVAATLNGTPSSKFIDLGNDSNSLFVLLLQPSFFTTEITTIDTTELKEQITTLDVLDPSQFNEYITLLESFLKYLREDVLVDLKREENNNQIEDWNLKVLDALRMLGRKITGRKRFFNNLGTDLNNDPIYKQHRISRKDYRQKLKNNTIHSVATDEIVLNKFSDDIADLTVLTTFTEMLGKTNTFMDKKRTIEIETPIV